MVAKKLTSKPSSKKMTNTNKTVKAAAKKPATKSVAKQTVKTTNGKKGLLNFLFSFNGNISKELFLGATLTLSVINLIIELLSAFIPENAITVYGTNIIVTVLMLMIISIGYKRAHSLGISGFYSLAGTLVCKPFFAFFTPANDMANDNQYEPKFTRTKKIGAFFNKNMGRQLLYIILLVLIALVPYTIATVQGQEATTAIKRIINFFIYLAGFNIVQIILLNTNLLKKYYTPIVKVLSFFGYTFIIIGTTILVYSALLMMAIAGM